VVRVKYKPSRDIPKAVRELGNLKPTKIVGWIREHRTERDVRGKRKQVERTPQSISHWFERNQEVFLKLEAELKAEELDKVVISENLFENGTFRETNSIKTWINDMKGRGAKGVSREKINSWVNCIRRVCIGNMRIKGGRIDIEGWGLKHPDKLTVTDAKDFIRHMNDAGFQNREWRLALRNFLTSKGFVVKSTDLSGELEHEAGQYADLYISKEKIYEILDWLKSINYEAYLASLFCYKTACRKTAMLEADASYINEEERTIVVFEKAQARRPKRRMVKIIPNDLWQLIKDREGKLFNITDFELCALLRQAYREVIPKLAERIPMPIHFWRHMFAQHMLRNSGWNLQLVAGLGGWTAGTLEKYYGKADQQTIRKFAKETLPQI